MSEIRWKLAEYLKHRGFTPDKLIAVLKDVVEPELIYRMVYKPTEQRQIDLSTLAAILEGLIKLTVMPVGVAEILEFVPNLPEEFLENLPWGDAFKNEDIEPYDWGDVDPMKLGKPVLYVHGIGLVVDDGEVAPTTKEDIKQLNRITLNPEVMGGNPCIRNLPLAVETLIALIASHYSTAEILQKYPELEEEDLHEALAYAAQRIEQPTINSKAELPIQR